MADLNSMPVEIIDQICLQLRGEIEDSTNANALSSFCGTSRKLHQTGLSHLYKDIDVSSEGTMVKLARTFLNNQQLADLVHEIEFLQYPSLASDRILEDHSASQQPDLVASEMIYTNGRLPTSEEWYAIRTLDLLLSRVRNVRVLAVNVHHRYCGTASFTYMRNKHIDDTSFLPRLEEAYFFSSDGNAERSIRLGSLPALLSLTQIRELKIDRCLNVPHFDNVYLPSVLEFTLMEVFMNGSELIRLTRIFPNLQLFDYTKDRIWRYEDTADDDYTITAATMSNAIVHLVKTLQTLSLSFVRSEHPDRASMASFVNFTRLRTLDIQMYALADRIEGDEHSSSADRESWVEDDDFSVAFQPWLHKLPRSLQHLRISGARKFSGSELAKLASRADEFPNLWTVSVDNHLLGIEALFRDTKIKYVDRGSPALP